MSNFNKPELHHWLFTFNSLDGHWYACTRDNYFDLFSDRRANSLVSHEDLEMLIEIVVGIESKRLKQTT
jgi:hypothetical protein